MITRAVSGAKENFATDLRMISILMITQAVSGAKENFMTAEI